MQWCIIIYTKGKVVLNKSKIYWVGSIVMWCINDITYIQAASQTPTSSLQQKKHFAIYGSKETSWTSSSYVYVLRVGTYLESAMKLSYSYFLFWLCSVCNSTAPAEATPQRITDWVWYARYNHHRIAMRIVILIHAIVLFLPTFNNAKYSIHW